MNQSNFNEKNLSISFLGLGCWRFGEEENPPASSNPGRNYWNGQSRAESRKIIDTALRYGINHFDTAQAYGFGKSEQITGQRLRQAREKVVIATKIIPSGNDLDAIIQKIKLSLRRLNTDYIDILYLHWPDRRYDIRTAVEALEKARKLGLIRFTGVSNFSVPEMERGLEAGEIDFCQTGYNLMWRHREKDVIPFCVSRGIGVIAYSFYAQGILLGRGLDTDSPFYSSWRKNLVFLKKENIAVTQEIVGNLSKISENSGLSIPRLLIGWASGKNWLTGVLVGASSRKQFEESIKASREITDSKTTEMLDNLSIMAENIRDTDNIFSHNVSAG